MVLTDAPLFVNMLQVKVVSQAESPNENRQHVAATDRRKGGHHSPGAGSYHTIPARCSISALSPQCPCSLSAEHARNQRQKSTYLRSHKHINTFTHSSALIIWPSEAAEAETERRYRILSAQCVHGPLQLGMTSRCQAVNVPPAHSLTPYRSHWTTLALSGGKWWLNQPRGCWQTSSGQGQALQGSWQWKNSISAVGQSFLIIKNLTTHKKSHPKHRRIEKCM